jgi:hypothetical protein
MSIIQEKIYLNKNSSGATLTFGLSSGINVSGYQQEIDRLTEETKQELINPITDYEISRFTYSRSIISTVKFYFLNSSNTSHQNSFTNAGFTSTELSNVDDVVRNSFFIVDFYDTYSSNTQTRLFTTYLTQIGSTPLYQINENVLNNQLSYWNVPKWFLDEQDTGLVTVYMKLSFYNAKDGKLLLFYNQAINDVGNPENLYFEVYLYPMTKTWRFPTAAVNAYELTPNSAYVERNNETFQNFENKKQTYPDGNVFEDDGTYDVVE